LGSFGIDSSPAIAPGGAIFVGALPSFASLTPSGAVGWTTAQQNSLATPTIAPDGTIYAGNGQTLRALTPGGAVIWSKTLGADPAAFEWVAIGPDGTLYVVDTYDSAAVYAVSPQDGAVKWAFNVGGNYGSAPVVGADGIVYVSLDQTLYALRPDGTQLWAFDVGGACGTPAIGADGTTYVVCGAKLYALGP
jgi:outer membrane protein assembly factor BamB